MFLYYIYINFVVMELNFKMPKINISNNINSFNLRYIEPSFYPAIPDCMVCYNNAVDLANELDLQPNQKAHVILSGNFIFGDFIEAFIMKNKQFVKELTISTLGLDNYNVDGLSQLMDIKAIDKLNIIVSDFYQYEKNQCIKYIYEKLDREDRFQLASTRSHMKVTLIETFNGDFWVIKGSANLRSSDNIEEVSIENNKALHAFYNDFQQRILNQYKTINKSIRGKELWRLVTNK